MLSIIVFAITPSSFENGSNCAVPSTLTPTESLILFIVSFALSPSTNALHVIVLLPSNKSNITSTFPLLSSLLSIFRTSPSSRIFPLSIPRSATLTNCSLIFKLRPYISGVFSSSTGGGGGIISPESNGGISPLIGTTSIGGTPSLLSALEACFFS